MIRSFGFIRLGLRSAIQSRTASLLVILVVMATAFAGAAAPGIFQRSQTATIRYGLNEVDRAQLDLTATRRGVPTPGGGTSSTAAGLPDSTASSWGAALDELDSLRSGLDPRLSAVMGAPRLASFLDRAPIDRRPEDRPAPLTELILTVDPFLDGRIDYVEGESPEAIETAVGSPDASDGLDVAGPLPIALSEKVAGSLNWGVGEERALDLPTTDGVDVVLTGVFRAVDPADGDWGHLPASLRVSIEDFPGSPPLYVGGAFLAPGSIANVSDLSDEASFDAWYPFRVDEVQGETSRTLTSLLRGFTSESFPFTSDVGNGTSDGLLFASTAPGGLDATQPRVDGMRSVLAMMTSGPVAVAILTLALSVRVLALQRRGLYGLARARGASYPSLLALLAGEGLVLGFAGASLGALLGVLSGMPGSDALIAPMIVAAIPALALPVTTVWHGRRVVRSEETSRKGPFRFAVELVVVVLAFVGVALVIARGRPEVGAGPGVDPLLTSLPVILAALGSLITIRLLPVLLGLLESRARRRAGLIVLLGPARARREAATRFAPVLAVVVGSSTVVFSGAFLASIDLGVDVAARAVVGADLRAVSSIQPSDVERIRALDGVAAVAPVYGDRAVDGVVPDGRVKFRVYVIDSDELRAVQGDADWALPVPASLGDESAIAVPVVASSDLAERVGAENLDIEGVPLDIEAVAPSSGPLGAARMWVAVDRKNADRITDADYGAPVILIDVASDSRGTDVASEVREALGDGVTIETPAEVAAERRDDPALDGVVSAVVAASGAVGIALALIIGITLILGSGARSKLLALLAAFGFRRRSGTLRLLIWEVAPAVVVAAPVGLVTGLVLASLVLLSVDLSALIGGESPPGVVIVGPMTIAPLAGLVTVAALSVAAIALVPRRQRHADSIRIFDEGA